MFFIKVSPAKQKKASWRGGNFRRLLNFFRKFNFQAFGTKRKVQRGMIWVGKFTLFFLCICWTRDNLERIFCWVNGGLEFSNGFSPWKFRSVTWRVSFERSGMEFSHPYAALLFIWKIVGHSPTFDNEENIMTLSKIEFLYLKT